MNLPNKLTLARILLIPVFVACMETIGTKYYIALFVFAIASFTDFLDGNIARKRGLVTTFGKFMDPLADKLLVLSAFVLLSTHGSVPGWITIVILARELTITGFRTIAASKGVILAAGKSGKIKTVTQMMTILIMLADDLRFWLCRFLLVEALCIWRVSLRFIPEQSILSRIMMFWTFKTFKSSFDSYRIITGVTTERSFTWLT